MAVDFFLKLDAIKGESLDSNHKDEIQIMSWSWGASQVTAIASGGGAGAGKANLSDLHIVKSYDVSSVPLYKALLLGTHIKTAVLTACKAGGDGKPFIQVSMDEVFVTSIQASGSSEIPTESVSFSYNKIKIEYSKQNAQGVLAVAGSTTYDLKANKVS
jgi:type VI secretion system secreted protein Hcp